MKLTFDEWKDKYCPGWYLNSQDEDEKLFEDYLRWRRENSNENDIIATSVQPRTERSTSY